MTSESAAPGTTVVCAVCGEDAPLALTAECNWCDRRYHLNQRNDGEAKDCGQVWIDEQYLALQFACFDCLRGEARKEEQASSSSSGRPAKTQRQRRYKRRP